jgi:predicted nucleic acid-binding protein
VILVVDASAALAWFFKDEATVQSYALLDRVKDEGARVPVIWRFEIANGFWSAMRRKRTSVAERDTALAQLSALPISCDFESHARAWTSIVALSDRYDLTPYDASYLELAIRLGAEIATRDAALSAAAKAAGLTTVPC